MAKFNCVGLRELEAEISRHAALVNDAAADMLNAGTDVLVEYQKGSIMVEGLVDSGDMLDSIKAGPVKNGKDGYYQEVWPQGTDHKGERNATKGFVLNYGTSKIKPLHWMENANDAANDDVVAAMRQVWNGHVERTES